MVSPKSVSEFPAERGLFSKRRAGPITEGAGKSSFTLTLSRDAVSSAGPNVRECDSLED